MNPSAIVAADPKFADIDVPVWAWLVLGGSIVTEIVFNYPGLGLTLFTASVARDYPVIQGQLLLMTLATLGANLLVDIVYGIVDPRLREAAA